MESTDNHTDILWIPVCMSNFFHITKELTLNVIDDDGGWTYILYLVLGIIAVYNCILCYKRRTIHFYLNEYKEYVKKRRYKKKLRKYWQLLDEQELNEVDHNGIQSRIPYLISKYM